MDATWRWLRATLHLGYFRRHAEWYDAYELAYGEPPLTGSVVDPETLGARVMAALEDAVTHWGESGLNPATMAACVRKAEGKE